MRTMLLGSMCMTQDDKEEFRAPDHKELLDLCAVDTELFGRTFFPKTFRQPSPAFAEDVWYLMDRSPERYINLQMFRGSAKTSRVRVFAAKRIAYGISRTIMLIGKSEGAAVRSLTWIKNAIEFNPKFSRFYGLRPGNKWQDSEIEIYHSTLDMRIYVLAAGVTGSIRGVNFDDYRPDLILLDDVIDEENAATEDQRSKITNLILGAVKESLAPASESADAKLILAQTPFNREDPSVKALYDLEWKSLRVGCWSRETEDLELEKQESSWPERWASETLRKEKRAAIRRNKLSVFMREKECKIVSDESAPMKAAWLKFYAPFPELEAGISVLAIDPVPPPSEIQVKKGLQNKDFEALSVVTLFKGQYYVREISANRGHEPNWTCAEFVRLASKYKVSSVVVEAVAYQRTLAWILRQHMKKIGRYWVVHEVDEKRKKYDRINDAISGVASEGALHVLEEQTSFQQQFLEFGVGAVHDDEIDSVAVAVQHLSANYANLDPNDPDLAIFVGNESVVPFELKRGAP